MVRIDGKGAPAVCVPVACWLALGDDGQARTLVDGWLCDGVTIRRYEWTRYPEAMGNVSGAGRVWRARRTEGTRIKGMLPHRVDVETGIGEGTHGRISSLRAMMFHLLGCYALSEDDRYLDPVRALRAHIAGKVLQTGGTS